MTAFYPATMDVRDNTLAKLLGEDVSLEEKGKRLAAHYDGATSLVIRYCADPQMPLVVAGMLKHTATIQALKFTNNTFNEEGTAAFADALAQNTTLLDLKLSRNNFGDEGAAILARALTRNTTLQTLKLNGCGIGAGGMEALADALKQNSSLQAIYLNGNEIGGGMVAIADMLKQNTSLVTIGIILAGLDGDGGGDGGRALLSALEVNTTLLSFDPYRVYTKFEPFFARNRELAQSGRRVKAVR